MRLAILALVLPALALSACAHPVPITANPIQTIGNSVGSTQLGGTVITGLQNAAYNLDQAIAIKVLAPTDPADQCVHSVLQTLGQDVGQTPVVVPQFTPKVSDLLSGGSVAYILAQQAKQLAGQGGLAVPVTCEQIVGEFVIKGVNAPANAIISQVVGVLP